MAQIVKWNDITFELGGSSLLGVEDISITGSCETEDSTVDGEKFVKRKNGKPYEIAMKAMLNASLGIDVQTMATKMTEAARSSTSGYFYVGSAKLFPCSFMMISADIGEIELNPQGRWVSCEVKIKLKQSTKYDGSTSSSSSGGGGGSSGGGSGGSSGSSSKKASKDTNDLMSVEELKQSIQEQKMKNAAELAQSQTKNAQSQSSSIMAKVNSSANSKTVIMGKGKNVMTTK